MLHFGWLEIRTDVFLLVCSVLLLLLQCLLCFRVKRRMLRLLPVLLLLGAELIFAMLAFVFDGWDSIGFLALSLCALFLLAVCGLGWGVWWLVRRKQKSKEK